MSVSVNLDHLADALDDFTFAYLVTVGDDYRAHTVAVEPAFSDGRLNVGRVGGRTSSNATSHADVTLVCPPRELGGYTLIIDGRAELADDSTLMVRPNRAVLHRKAAPDSPATTTGCLHDCVPLTKP